MPRTGGPPAAPLPIRVLAEQTETPAFLEALTAYVRNGRIEHCARPPEPRPAELYVAVVTAERVLGIFLVDDEGYLEVRRQQRRASLRLPEFAGARQIWLIPVQR